MLVIKCRRLRAATYKVEKIDLSEDEGGQTGGSREEGRSGDGTSSTGDLGRAGAGGGGGGGTG